VSPGHDLPIEMFKGARMHGTFTFVYRVGQRVLHVVGNDGRWRVTVDGAIVDGTFATKPGAWAAGVGEADRLDRVEGSAAPASGAGGRDATRGGQG
jgi:hypothetical protein